MNIPKGSAVCRVRTYEFTWPFREGHPDHPNLGMIRISVKRNIAKPDSDYLAIPEKQVLGTLVQASVEYRGDGRTEEEALDQCIERMAMADFTDIFPSSKK